MISITRLPQAKKRLEEDLKKVYNSAYKSYNDYFSEIWDFDEIPDEMLLLRDKTEDEIIEYLIQETNPDLSETERKTIKLEREAEAKEIPGWGTFIRLINVISRKLRYKSAFPKIIATAATLWYDVLMHSILFSNWRWNNEEFDLKDLDIQLSPKEVCDRLFDCNPDVVSVLIYKMEGCSIADREILQSAFETGQKEAVIESLKGLSVSDYNSLVLFVSCLHLEDAFISVDLERLEILQNHIAFENQIKLNLSTPLKKSWEMNSSIKYPSSDKANSAMDSYCDLFEPILDSLRDIFLVNLKLLPNGLELIKPQPFPFEKKYLDDLLNDPDVESFLDELPENSDEVIGVPEDQEQPEPQQEGKPEEQESEGEGKPDTASPREIIDEDDLRRLSDKVFNDYTAIGDKKAYFQGSMIDTATALRMSVIYDLFKFLVSEGKMEKRQEMLDLLAFRLTGKDPYGIGKTKKKLVWKGTKSDYSLCYFLWKMFAEEKEEGGSNKYDTQYWSKAEKFFIYSDGKLVDGRDEQTNRQQFTNKTGQDVKNKFAKELRNKLKELKQKQADMKSTSK